MPYAIKMSDERDMGLLGPSLPGRTRSDRIARSQYGLAFKSVLIGAPLPELIYMNPRHSYSATAAGS